MRLADADYVIVQAGGRGSRLGPLTANKPKCLLSVDGEPLLYRLFRQLPRARFIIIGDYRFEALRNYLAVIAPPVPYKLLRTSARGNLAGLRDAVAAVGDSASFLVLWSDLFFGSLAVEVPNDRAVVGLSDSFPCRWSASLDGQLAEVPSADRGVAGVFFFPAAEFLPGLPGKGEFVHYLQQRALPLACVVVPGMREFGTAQAVAQHQGDQSAVRFFNDVELGARTVVKQARLEKYRHLIEAEIRWYDAVSRLGFRHIPEIINRSPLTLSRIPGEHPFALTASDGQKAAILTSILDCLQELHQLGRVPCDPASSWSVYYQKTLDRLNGVRDLIPNVGQPILVVNGRPCRNPLHPHYEQWFRDKIAALTDVPYCIIHGDPTFSNTLADVAGRVWLIDPRGSFGRSEVYGDPRYDWAKVLYSVAGNYDQFNQRKFRLSVSGPDVVLEVTSSGWEAQAELIRDRVPGDAGDLDLIHALIWLSLSGYVVDDLDSVLGAFYRGIDLLERTEG